MSALDGTDLSSSWTPLKTAPAWLLAGCKPLNLLGAELPSWRFLEVSNCAT
jgi:hypothetical protein